MATSREPKVLQAIGAVFVILSLGTMLWRAIEGTPIGAAELGTLTGGPLVLGYGLSLARRRRREAR